MMFSRKKKKVGLALGSGAARGMAHIGVLKVLEQEGIQIDYLSGTSIGAVIAALYAAGVPVAQMEEVARDVDWQRMARLLDPILPTSGIIDGKKVTRFMSELLPVHTFEELNIPFATITTDVETGEAVVIKKGNLLEALRAAVAFPGLFTPVRFGDRFLIDGGLLNPVPVDLLHSLGAETVVGVCTIPEVKKRAAEAFLPANDKAETKSPLFEMFNAQAIEKILGELGYSNGRNKGNGPKPKDRRPPGIFRIFAQSVAIMENQINALQLERNETDLLIRPDLLDINLLEFHRAAEAIQAGEQATRPMVNQIKKLIGH